MVVAFGLARGALLVGWGVVGSTSADLEEDAFGGSFRACFFEYSCQRRYLPSIRHVDIVSQLPKAEAARLTKLRIGLDVFFIHIPAMRGLKGLSSLSNISPERI